MNARPDRLNSQGGCLKRECLAPPCFDFGTANDEAGEPQEDAVMSELRRAQAMVKAVQRAVAAAAVSRQQIESLARAELDQSRDQ